MTLEIFYSKLSLKRDSELKGSGGHVAIWVTRNSLIMLDIWRSLWDSSSLSWHQQPNIWQQRFDSVVVLQKRIWAIWKFPPRYMCGRLVASVFWDDDWGLITFFKMDFYNETGFSTRYVKKQLLSLSPSWNWKLDRSWSLNTFSRLYGGEVWSWKGSTVIYALFMCTCIKAICFLEVLLRCNIAGFEQISTWVEFRTEHTRQMLLTKWKYDVGESKHKNGIFTVSYVNEECCVCLFFSY